MLPYIAYMDPMGLGNLDCIYLISLLILERIKTDSRVDELRWNQVLQASQQLTHFFNWIIEDSQRTRLAQAPLVVAQHNSCFEKMVYPLVN